MCLKHLFARESHYKKFTYKNISAENNKNFNVETIINRIYSNKSRYCCHSNEYKIFNIKFRQYKINGSIDDCRYNDNRLNSVITIEMNNEISNQNNV